MRHSLVSLVQKEEVIILQPYNNVGEGQREPGTFVQPLGGGALVVWTLRVTCDLQCREHSSLVYWFYRSSPLSQAMFQLSMEGSLEGGRKVKLTSQDPQCPGKPF